MRSRIRCVRPSENTDHHEHPFDTQRHPFNSQECFHEAGATTDPRPLSGAVSVVIVGCGRSWRVSVGRGDLSDHLLQFLSDKVAEENRHLDNGIGRSHHYRAIRLRAPGARAAPGAGGAGYPTS